LQAHPALHPIFEFLGYACAYLAYTRGRRRSRDPLTQQQRWTLLATAALGALFGSHLLGVLEQAPDRHLFVYRLFLPDGGKTVVGGLLGGWIGVELAKKLEGVRARTGDVFAIPLCIGIAVGRVGCFLAGLADDTYGKQTHLPWGVDFGDGILRHPTQLYEIIFLLLLASLLHWMAGRPYPTGTRFRVFLAAYLAWRFLIDFLKPQPLLAGMNCIQWVCLFGLIVLTASATHDRGFAGQQLITEDTENA
jgi:phosphatidylglycerol:prolipoprotein diacylglycerol transferase